MSFVILLLFPLCMCKYSSQRYCINVIYEEDSFLGHSAV
jgi:hypothetical protein